MLPMPLAWCFCCALLTCLGELISFWLRNNNNNQPGQLAWPGQLIARLLVYATINLVCLYTKYLIDLAQRNAFLETRRSIETRAKIERENDKQERLLLSLLPKFVALEIIADIAKEDNHERLLKNQFHKIYIHSYSNVR